MICCPYAYCKLYPPYLAQILGDLVTCWVEMISLCHDWGWQSPQTSSHIHIRHVHSVWAHWYALHMHMVAALHSYTLPTWLRFWGSGSLVESKWCHHVMLVEADSHLKLLPASILDIYKVSEHIDMLSIAYGSCLTQLYLPYLAQMLGFWVTCEVKIMSLCHRWGGQSPQTSSQMHIRHIQSVWAHWYAVHWHTVGSLHRFTHCKMFEFWGSGSLVFVESKWCHYVMVEADSHLKLLLPLI